MVEQCQRLAELGRERICRLVLGQIRLAVADYCLYWLEAEGDEPFCDGSQGRLPLFPQSYDELPVVVQETLPRYLDNGKMGLYYSTRESAATLYNAVMAGRPLPFPPPRACPPSPPCHRGVLDVILELIDAFAKLLSRSGTA